MNPIIQYLIEADAIKVNGGPLLSRFGYDDNEIEFSWMNDHGDRVVQQIAVEEATMGTLDANCLTMVNVYGDIVKIETYKLTPLAFERPIHPDAFARYVADLLHRLPGYEEELIEHLDIAIDDQFGREQASMINNQGVTHQILALVNQGKAAEAVAALSATTLYEPENILSKLRAFSAAVTRTAVVN